MLRRLFLAGVAIAVTAPVALAQDAVGTRIYVALYNIHYGDIPQWTADYREHFAPILEELVSEGALTAFNMRMHHTGGEYTMRQGLVGDEDTNFEAVWEAYLGRSGERSPVASERTNRMILAHTDEIWNLDVTNLPTGADTQYAYEAQFQVNFADIGRWNAIWTDRLIPAMDQAIEEGILQGYVIEGHNTGGPYNWKFLALYDEWDNFDEIEAAVFGAAPLDNEIWMMFTAHKDEIWTALPPPG